MNYPIINAQGILSNPNLALAAARDGTLDQRPRGATARIDARAMADAILRLLRDPDLRKSLGRAGRTAVLERFLPERQAREVVAIYREICGID